MEDSIPDQDIERQLKKVQKSNKELKAEMELLKKEKQEDQQKYEKLIRLLEASKTVDKAILTTERDQLQNQIDDYKCQIDSLRTTFMETCKELKQKQRILDENIKERFLYQTRFQELIEAKAKIKILFFHQQIRKNIYLASINKIQI